MLPAVSRAGEPARLMTPVRVTGPAGDLPPG